MDLVERKENLEAAKQQMSDQLKAAQAAIPQLTTQISAINGQLKLIEELLNEEETPEDGAS